MSDQTRLAEDRALRDAARGLVNADVSRLKASLEERSIPARARDRVAEGAIELLEQVGEAADRNKGMIAAVAGAAALWLARNPLLALFNGPEQPSADPEPHDDQP